MACISLEHALSLQECSNCKATIQDYPILTYVKSVTRSFCGGTGRGIIGLYLESLFKKEMFILLNFPRDCGMIKTGKDEEQ